MIVKTTKEDFAKWAKEVHGIEVVFVRKKSKRTGNIRTVRIVKTNGTEEAKKMARRLRRM